ncbi:uncharacterized protein LOC132263266 [Phlebotomus argentipes]|uniref:uncharacterized protein LOC132263266 n=1 Tax=Phlebotomus argentipes TaxID=94469 RepID=UPI00289350FC|nr:uncharacterized protein LOC132263266 [Phlebotomus argentipes]
MINRTHWGGFKDGSDKKKEIQPNDIIYSETRCDLLAELQQNRESQQSQTEKLHSENVIVTQTVEVINQREMIQTLIDTYVDKSGLNYVLNPCQKMPSIDFPPGNSANLIKENNNPFCFSQPRETRFTRGEQMRTFPRLEKTEVDAAIRRSLGGLLKIAGYTEAQDSAMVMFVDAVDYFYKSLMEYTNEAISQDQIAERHRHLDVMILEKAYMAMSGRSLTNLHNYYKDNVIGRNRVEIKEFKNTFQEYDKFMQESQNMHKSSSTIKEEDYMAFMDFSVASRADSSVQENPQSNAQSESGDLGGFRDIFEGDLLSTGTTDGSSNSQQGLEPGPG